MKQPFITIATALALTLTFGMAYRSNAARLLGIDVYSGDNNGNTINWSTVKSGGISWAICKATQGNYYEDPQFANNMNNAKAAGVPIGCYDFADPASCTPSTEANYFWNYVKGYIKHDNKTLMPMLDWEPQTIGEASGPWMGASSAAEWVNQWCQDVTSLAAGSGIKVIPIVYCSAGWTCTYLNSSLDGWTIPNLANYNGQNPQTGSPWDGSGGECQIWGAGVWDIWQFTSTATISGISGPCDEDVFNGSSIASLIVTANVMNDWDGDGISDFVTVNTNTFVWSIRFSHDGSLHTYQFGTNGDIPMVAQDLNRDGLADYVIYRPSNHSFYYTYNGGGTQSFVWTNGIPLMSPISMDGNGVANAVTVSTNASHNLVWNVRYSHDGSNHPYQFGTNGDIPFIAQDLNRDNLADYVVYRPSNHSFYFTYAGGGTASFVWTNGLPLMSGISYDQNGVAQAVTINTNSNPMVWNIRWSHDGSNHSYAYGSPGDVPCAKFDVNGDGIMDYVVYRPSNHAFYYLYGGGGGSGSFVWGDSNSIPVF
ncbi:MAG TPA: GH25 family lysozyme [Verrucomicrobiae bacterium]|jgi:hypothetical protein|nr:GH25 family lysozyme [Verrucomicrobiae bacterium]